MIYVCIPTTPGRRKRLETCVSFLRESTIPFTLCTFENTLGGFVPAIHAMLENIDGLVWCIGDDVEVAPDCLEKLYKAHQENFPDNDGLVQPYDELHNGNISVNPFCHSSVMKKYTYKGYVHNYADVEFTDIMRARGKYLYVPEAKVHHAHRIIDKSLTDETYEKCHQFMKQDQALYNSRRANGYYPRNS